MMQDAYALDDYDKAKAQLERLAKSLDEQHPSAASSLREGLDETLTVLRLGIGPTLRKSLSTTNPIESTFSKGAPRVAASDAVAERHDDAAMGARRNDGGREDMAAAHVELRRDCARAARGSAPLRRATATRASCWAAHAVARTACGGTRCGGMQRTGSLPPDRTNHETDGESGG